jgi:hypothetical protein
VSATALREETAVLRLDAAHVPSGAHDGAETRRGRSSAPASLGTAWKATTPFAPRPPPRGTAAVVRPASPPPVPSPAPSPTPPPRPRGFSTVTSWSIDYLTK